MMDPPASTLFQPVGDRYGTRLALVFGNHNQDGLCPFFAADRCHHCDIGAGEGRAFDLSANRDRLEWFEQRYATLLPEVAHLILYNSGNVLNPREMPPELLLEITRWARRWPSLKVVSLDSREPFVTRDRLVNVGRELSPGWTLRPILGLETADDVLRDDVLQKGMPRKAILRALAAVGEARALLAGHIEVGLDVNVVVGGPGTVAGTVVADALGTVRTVLGWAIQFGFSVDFNLHAYYPSTRGRARFPEHQRCSLPALLEVVHALRAEIPADTGLFIGYQDEGHDLEQTFREGELSRAQSLFDAFNRTQEPATLAL